MRIRSVVKLSLVLILILVLTTEGYYLYSYYANLPSGLPDSGSVDSGSTSAVEDSAGLPGESTVFVHRVTPENNSANSTYLDNPLTNGNPAVVVVVTQSWNPGGQGGTYNDHSVGVWYDASRDRWAIFNQDREPMPDDAAFNVLVFPDSTG
ncbi:DUF7452 domain-containing protein [Rubrobacter aplysinae]|uniref:DUF7452 domain-containing protein n=1 Tax=Rubrobacter aplysinae TaxID=909625 RepID=UPI00064B9D95|nr:hypothetical protein [Rubrobacter aplysinae]